MVGDGAGAQISYQQYQMLQTLRRLSDQASYYWQKDVVGYDQDKQADSLLKWFNIRSVMQQITWLTISAVMVMAILIFIIWQRRRKRWHPADLPLEQLSKRMSNRDKSLARTDDEGQLAWLERLAKAIDSEEAQAKIIQLQQGYRQLRYGHLSSLEVSHHEYQKVLKQLKKTVRELR